MIVIIVILIIALLGYVYLSTRLEQFTPGASPNNYNKRLTTTPLPTGTDDVSSLLGTGTEVSSAGVSTTSSDSSSDSSSGSSDSSSSSSSSSSFTGSSSTSSGWQQNILDYHNNVRQQCSSDNVTMTWDSDLAAYAQDYADQLSAAKQLTHSYDGHDSYKYSGHSNGAGENLWANEGGASGITDTDAAKSAVNAWAGEGYGADADPNALETGHYTAMNWRTSSKLGCGVSRNTDTGWAVVSCNYADGAANYCCTGDQYQQFASDPSMDQYMTTKGNTTSFDAMGYFVQCSKPLAIKD